MAEFPALPLWTDALVGDTYHLTPAEFGAYMRLLISAWRTTDCALPDDDVLLGRIVGDPKNWHRLKQRVLPFLSMGSDGFWRQKRLSDERTFVRNKQARASAGGKGKALKGRHKASAKPVLNECLTSAPTPTPTPTNKIVSLEFEKFKKVYPERKGGQGWTEAKKHFDRAIKEGCAATDLILAAEKYKRTIQSAVGTEFVPMARTWLSKRDYRDFLPTPEDAAKEAKIAEFMRSQGKVWVEGKGWVALGEQA